MPGSKYHALLTAGYPFNPHDADLGEREGGREGGRRMILNEWKTAA